MTTLPGRAATSRNARSTAVAAALAVAVALALPVAAGCTGGATAPEAHETSGAPVSTGTAKPQSPPPSPPRTVSLLTSGDVLLHAGTWRTAEADAARLGEPGLDFGPMLADVAPVVRAADLAVCHLETPLAPARGPFLSCPVFSVPPQVAAALIVTGYDACSAASNHSLDQGYEGLARTLRTLDAAGLPHDGTARSREEQREPLLLDADGVRVAVLSYTYGTNGIPLPQGKPWSVPLIEPGRIVQDAAAAREAGEDVVAVALHFGTEYVTAPDTYQVDVVDAITRSPAIDVVYGHHTHTVQSVDRVHGTWVAYGLGNFVAEQESFRPHTYQGVSMRFELLEGRRGRFEVSDVAYLPTMITRYDPADPRMRVLDVPAALADQSTDPALRAELEATLADVRVDVLSLDADSRDPDVRVHLLRR